LSFLSKKIWDGLSAPKGYFVLGTFCPKDRSVAGTFQPGTLLPRTFRPGTLRQGTLIVHSIYPWEVAWPREIYMISHCWLVQRSVSSTMYCVCLVDKLKTPLSTDKFMFLTAPANGRSQPSLIWRMDGEKGKLIFLLSKPAAIYVNCGARSDVFFCPFRNMYIQYMSTLCPLWSLCESSIHVSILLLNSQLLHI
jgi:hypothetical protein